VSYSVGRESSATYNESLAGYRRSNAGHEFGVAVNPVGDDGQLLPMVNGWADPTAVQGQADKKVRACVRTCVAPWVPHSVTAAVDDGPTALIRVMRLVKHELLTLAHKSDDLQCTAPRFCIHAR